jgi:hypothetical protein
MIALVFVFDKRPWTRGTTCVFTACVFTDQPAHTACQLRQQYDSDQLCIFHALERRLRCFVRQPKSVPSISGLYSRDRVRTARGGVGEQCRALRRLGKLLPPRFYHRTCGHVLAVGGSGVLETELKATSGPRDSLDVHCVDGLAIGSSTQLQTAPLVALSTDRTQGDNTPIKVTRPNCCLQKTTRTTLAVEPTVLIAAGNHAGQQTSCKKAPHGSFSTSATERRLLLLALNRVCTGIRSPAPGTSITTTDWHLQQSPCSFRQ